jgi:hypothetical protein
MAVLSPIRNVWSAALLQAKNEDRVKVYANVSGRSGVIDPGRFMEMRCALVLISLAASEGVFRITGFKERRFDRCAISFVASRPGNN